MKTDLATSVIAAIFGVVAAYFVCGLFLPSIDDVTIKTINSTANYTLTQPNPEVFNFRAINPTVEVYVGQCAEYNEYGDCVEMTEEVETYEENPTIEEIEEESTDQESTNQESTNQTPSENQEVNEGTQNGTSN